MAEQDAGAESEDKGQLTESLFERALSRLPRSAVAIIGRDFRIIKAFGEIFEARGYDPATMAGRALAELFPGEPFSDMAPALRSALAGDEISFESLAADGITWYMIDLRPIREDGNVVAILCSATDVTDRKLAEIQVAEERQFFEDVLDSIEHLVSVKDSDRRVLHLNRTYEKYMGFSRSEAYGRPISEFFDPEFQRRFARDDLQVLKSGETVRSERLVPAADGTFSTFLTERAALRRSDGSIYGVVTVGLDISERLAAEEDVADLTKRFETAFVNAPNGMALIQLNGRFMRVNPAMSDLTGYSEAELTGLRVADITHPEDLEEQIELLGRAIAGEFDSYSLEKRFARKSGELVWLVLSVSLVRSPSGEPLYVIAQTTNISDRKQVEADLMTEVGRDALTELANRRQLESALNAQIEKCHRDGTEASLLLLDFDRFKQVNDRHGHDTGDGALRFVARELTGQIRSTDLAARIGGDEFVLLLKGAGPKRAAKIAGELMVHFDNVVFEPEGLNLPCPVSVGSTGIDAGTADAQQALREADLSMYEAKRARKDA